MISVVSSPMISVVGLSIIPVVRMLMLLVVRMLMALIVSNLFVLRVDFGFPHIGGYAPQNHGVFPRFPKFGINIYARGEAGSDRTVGL